MVRLFQQTNLSQPMIEILKFENIRLIYRLWVSCFKEHAYNSPKKCLPPTFSLLVQTKSIEASHSQVTLAYTIIARNKLLKL